MKVCLIDPPRPFLINQLALPSLGLLYLSAVLKQTWGHEVEVVDLAAGTPIPDADVYGITCTTPSYPYAREVGLSLLARGRVVLGGPHVQHNSGEVLRDGFHVCIGEGEIAFPGMLNAPSCDAMAAGQMLDLDVIPFPDRGALPMERYTFQVDGVRAASIMTSRGCPYGCAFCVKTWHNVRYRSAPNVLAEVEELKHRWGYKGAMLYDDEMFMNRPRDLLIAQGLKDMGFVWRCFSRANLLTEQVVKTAARCGCREILIGCESGSDRILNNIHKGTTRALNLKAIRLLKQYGIRAKAALIVGLPGEDEESLAETWNFCEEAEADDYDFTVLQVYRGSAIAAHPEDYDVQFSLEGHGFYKGTPGHYTSGVRTSALTGEQIVAARDRLEARFKPKGLLR